MIMDAGWSASFHFYINSFQSPDGTIKKGSNFLHILDLWSILMAFLKIMSQTFKLFIYCVAAARRKIIQPEGFHIFKYEPYFKVLRLLLSIY